MCSRRESVHVYMVQCMVQCTVRFLYGVQHVLCSRMECSCVLCKVCNMNCVLGWSVHVYCVQCTTLLVF